MARRAAPVSRETSAADEQTLDELAGALDEQDLGDPGEQAGPGLAEALAAAEQLARDSGEPVVLEAGRYKLGQAPDGAWLVARAVNTCERCQGCGCGEQAKQITIPAMVIKLALMQGGGFRDKLRAMRAAAAGGDQ